MSYSFFIKAKTKAEARDQIQIEFDKVVGSQPIHASDRYLAQVTADAFIMLLAEPTELETVNVNVSGSLSWRDLGIVPGANGVFTGAQVSVGAGIRPIS